VARLLGHNSARSNENTTTTCGIYFNWKGPWRRARHDSTGVGVGNFAGRFSSETFIISPGAVPAPNAFPDPPAVVPEATGGVKTNPVQMYHLGLWFDTAADAGKAGCSTTQTPFNGEHNAGIQVLNTATFPDIPGPLFGLQ
jgi:hypothetical protein